MFFEVHQENKIGYKILSEADLGVAISSHQTHLGLSQFVLTFLPDRDQICENSIFIYEDKFEYINSYFDRIENPDGSFRSPKMRIGDRGCISIVSTIREIVNANQIPTIWYLLWFGLKNEKIVFFLFNNNSTDYLNIEKYGLKFDKKGARAIGKDNPAFDVLVQYLENKVNANGFGVLRELEVVSQTQAFQQDKRFKQYDIDKANEKFREIGKTGERKVAEYLSHKVKIRQIVSFTWHNENGESGLPYDLASHKILCKCIFLTDKIHAKTMASPVKQVWDLPMLAVLPERFGGMRARRRECRRTAQGILMTRQV